MPRPRKRGKRGSAVHEGLVGARELVGTPYLADPALRAEYARDIAPRTEAALARLSPRSTARAARRRRRAPSISAQERARWDVCCAARFGESFEVVAVDRTAGPGVVRANLAVELPAVPERLGGLGKFDLVVAAHLLTSSTSIARRPSGCVARAAGPRLGDAARAERPA